jgi:hypothetical protein
MGTSVSPSAAAAAAYGTAQSQAALRAQVQESMAQVEPARTYVCPSYDSSLTIKILQ